MTIESVSLHPKQPVLLQENGKLLRGNGGLRKRSPFHGSSAWILCGVNLALRNFRAI